MPALTDKEQQLFNSKKEYDATPAAKICYYDKHCKSNLSSATASFPQILIAVRRSTKSLSSLAMEQTPQFLELWNMVVCPNAIMALLQKVTVWWRCAFLKQKAMTFAMLMEVVALPIAAIHHHHYAIVILVKGSMRMILMALPQAPLSLD